MKKTDNRKGIVGLATIALDICVIISGIVVGALALLGQIDLPPAASYAALGVGCGFLALDVAYIIGIKAKNHSHDYERVQ